MRLKPGVTPLSAGQPLHDSRSRLLPGWTPALAAAALSILPTEALAHASDRGHVLLLPTGYYLLGGGLAVAASFAVLMRLRGDALDRLYSARLSIGSIGDGWRLPASLLSFGFLAILVAAGFWGSRDPLSNPLPLTIWTLVWVGLTLAQGLFGNLWAWIDPWYGPWRALNALRGRKTDDAPPLELPAWLGMWPALLLFFAFAWFELIYPAPDDPAILARIVGLYWLLTLAAMLAFGHGQWSRRGEFLSVFFGLVARFGMVEKLPAAGGKSRLNLCLPGAKLATTMPLPPSGMLFLLAALGSVSFDGFSKTFFWLGANGVNPLEFPGRTALAGINTAGLLGACMALATLFFLCVQAGVAAAGGRRRPGIAAGLLVWSIVPIALAYHLAHYLTALLVNGQYAMVALSDPFALGWNLLGTAYMQVGAGVAMGSQAAWTIWNIQAAAIVGGHVIAVLTAHQLAFRLHKAPRAALASQLPLTLLMIAYTVLGLWLLSTPTAG